MQLSIRNRIALYFVLTFAVMGSLTALAIYFIVKQVTYLAIDNDLREEVALHLEEFVIERDTFYFKNKNEWLEREHSEVEVYPVFMQLQKKHQVIDKSPNLKNNVLTFVPEQPYLKAFDTKVNDRNIRQMQAPIRYENTLLGEIIIAVPIDNAFSVLQSLKSLLYFLIPINILLLFIVLRYITHLSIQPLAEITESVDNITSKNIQVKLNASKNKDEIDRLSRSINKLLTRLQKALDGERHFAINASHELRTPLSVIKGKLEVLNRRERSSEEIKASLNDVLKYVQQMDMTIDQLLNLAEMSTEDRENLLLEEINLCELTDELRVDYQKELHEKKLQLLCE
ncbi:MAG: histidine kinase dimerization/phospho-acceptor domain-containing protein, partial [Flavobacteriaceae bacterium]|nr:histidine kinase dimerization/phospho-acceptor domain-containing protein [Flavobacteriaceae bacterium]